MLVTLGGIPDCFVDLITPKSSKFQLYFYQRLFLRVIFRYKYVYGVLNRGASKCVAEDTIIITEDGMKEIGSLCGYDKDEKEFLFNTKVANGLNGISETHTLFINGKKETKKIKTSSGYELEGTLNHPVMIMNKDGDFEWKELSEVKNGDFIALSRGQFLFGKNTELKFNMETWYNNLHKNTNNLVIPKTPNQLNKDIARYFGYLIGDGCLTRDNVVLFTNEDKDLLDDFINITNNYFDMEVKVRNRKNNTLDLVIHGKAFREYLNQLGLKQVDAFSKEIPQCIMDAPKEMVSEFLKGLFDTDGTISKHRVSFCTASEKMSKQIQTILLNYNIISIRNKKYNKRFNTYSYIIDIYGENIDRFYKEIGFGCKRKQDKLIEFLNVVQNTLRNPNKDIIPHQRKRITRLTDKNKYKYDYKFKHSVQHVRQGNNELTYKRLNNFLKYDMDIDEDLIYLNGLNDLNYYWDSIKDIQNSENYVYDIFVPDNSTFIGNGFVNHNSFISILGLILKCIMYPNSKLFLASGGKEQSANIAREKIEEVFTLLPLLAREVKEFTSQKDYVRLVFHNGSKFDIVAVQNSTRGGRRTGGLIEEAILVDGDLLNSVIIPLMAVDRMSANGKIDHNEIHKSQIYITSAGDKSIFAYHKLRELVKRQVLKGDAFVFGADYRLPVLYGLLDPNFVNDMREDGTYNPYDFLREWGSIWTGAGKDAFFDLTSIERNRILQKVEHLRPKKGSNDIYIISCDTSRCEGKQNADTGIVVIKLKLNENGTYTKHIVNVITIPSEHFEEQAIYLKKLVFKYNASMLIVDANGLGVGLVDFCIKSNFDPETNEILPPFAVVNDERYDKYRTDDALPLLYNIKSGGGQGELSSAIHVNCLSQISSGKVKFLVDEITGKTIIKGEKKQMDANEEVDNLLPYIRTSLMQDQMMNLRSTQQGKNVTLKPVSRSINKDLFSALEYGLHYIVSVMEEENRQNMDGNNFDASQYCLVN